MAHVCSSWHLHTCSIKNVFIFDAEDLGFPVVGEMSGKHNWVLVITGLSVKNDVSCCFPFNYELSFPASSSSSSSSFPSTSSSSPVSPMFPSIQLHTLLNTEKKKNQKEMTGHAHSRVYFGNDYANNNFRYLVLRLQALCQTRCLSCLSESVVTLCLDTFISTVQRRKPRLKESELLPWSIFSN